MFLATVLWLWFKLHLCLFDHTRDTSVIYKKVTFVAIATSEIHICTNKHETGIVHEAIIIVLLVYRSMSSHERMLVSNWSFGE